MAVAFDRSSESHAAATGSASEASFSWFHGAGSNVRGVLVYTFTNANADDATAVSYGGVSLTAVASGRAVDSAGEAGDAKAWFLGSGLPNTEPATPTTAWSSAASGTTVQLQDIAYGNGYWVAVGLSNTLRYATDPTGTWSAASSPGFGDIYGVAYGNGYWVGVGASGGLRYATDPTGTWTAASSPGFGTSTINAVFYGNGYWVAVGNDGKVRYATDPTGTWSGASSPGFGISSVEDVAYGNGYWVAGSAGGPRYATDPTGTWSAPASSFSATSVAYGNGYWVAGGAGGTLRYATDPTGTWSAPSSSGFGTSAINGLAYGNGYWVGVANSTTLRYATDPTGTWSGVSVAVASIPLAVDFADGKWVTVGQSGLIAIPGGGTVVVTRNNNANTMYAVAATVKGATDTEVTGVNAPTGGDGTLAEVNVDDGSPGTSSLRFAAVNSGLDAVNLATTSTAANTLVLGANSTGLQSIQFVGTEPNYLVSTTAISTTASGTSIASGSTQAASFTVALTLVRTGLSAGAFLAESAVWRITYVLTSVTANYAMRLKLQRRNSSGTMQTESSYGSTRAASGTFTDSLTWTPGTWAAGDQLALVWEHYRPSGTGNQSASMTANGSSYIDAPNTARVNGFVRETTAGQGSRPVGFQSTTSDDAAVVYLAIREPAVVVSSAFSGWGIPVR